MITGKLEFFFETGTEGVVWAFTDSSKTGYDSLHWLGNGDVLKIFDAEDNVLWEGPIKFSKKLCWVDTEENGSGQSIGGWWISPMSGVQEGVDPPTWAKWFADGLRAELERKKKGP